MCMLVVNKGKCYARIVTIVSRNHLHSAKPNRHELSFSIPQALQVHHLCSIYAPHLEHAQPTDSLCLDLEADET